MNNCPKYLLTDEECVCRIRKGEFDALRVLYERYYPLVWQYIKLKVTQAEDVDDICSQVWKKVLDKITQLKKPRCFSSWLYRLVDYQVIDYYRQQKRDAKRYSGKSIDSENFSRRTKEEQNYAHRLSEQVQNILRLMPSQNVQVLQLKIGGGLTYAEIGKIMGKSESAVQKMFARAKKKFRILYLQKYKSPLYLDDKESKEQ